MFTRLYCEVIVRNPFSLSDKDVAQKNKNVLKNAVKVGKTQINSILALCHTFNPDRI